MASKEKRLVLVVGDKGGTAKSLFTKLLWEKIRHTHASARAFDADGTTGSFVSVYGAYTADGDLLDPQPADGVTPIFLHGDERDRDQIIRVVQTGADLVLVDMPATSLTVLHRLEADWGFFAEVGRAGYSVSMVNVVTPFPSSLSNVLKTFALAPNASNVVVRNEFFGDEDDYYMWEGSERRNRPVSKGKTVLAERGGIEIVLPKVKTAPLVYADVEILTFGKAIEGLTKEGLVPDANRLRRWLEDAYDAMIPAEHLLGLAVPKTNGKVAKAAEVVEAAP
jgi:hypothetical protein